MDERIALLRERAKNDGEPVLRDKSLELLLAKVRVKKPKKILEVGTNVGLSGIAMLLENADSSITGIEIDEEKARIAKENYESFGLADRCKIFVGDAGEIIPVLSGNYDLIFLDGPKGHYFEYLENLLSVLNTGGILFADDVLFHGYIKGKTPHKHATIKNSMTKFIDTITTNENLKTEFFDIEDGVSITEKIK